MEFRGKVLYIPVVFIPQDRREKWVVKTRLGGIESTK